jgi:aromatase
MSMSPSTTAPPGHRKVEHDTTIQAPAADVYRLLVDVTNWPQIFPPSVHIEYLERSDTQERIQLWATANGEAKTWISRRDLDPVALRIGFRQERSTPPVGAMGGTWIVEPITDDECHVRLLHDYRAVDDDPAKHEWIAKAVDRNSRSELAALKADAELRSSASELLLTLEDSVTIDGSASDAYDFVNEAQLWSERLPHVARVALREDTPGLQVLEMDTRTKDGSTHTTTSVRVTFPPERIAYKQIQVPALMTLHTGLWTFTDIGNGGSTASSRHTVVLNEANIAGVLGPDAGVAEARTFVGTALSTNSLATLGLAKAYAELRRPVSTVS